MNAQQRPKPRLTWVAVPERRCTCIECFLKFLSLPTLTAMKTSRAFKPWMLILLGLVVLAALLILYLQWRGPLVPGYQVAPTTLV